MKLNTFLALFFVVIAACKKDRSFPENKTVMTQEHKSYSSIDIKTDSVTVNGAIGVISDTDEFNFNDTLNIYNKKNKIISNFILRDEYQVLALNCLSFDDKFFVVKLDDGRTGYIPRNSHKIIFRTWPQHILSVFCVGFDDKKNPIFYDHLNRIVGPSYNKDEVYEPNKIDGDWLQIKWGDQKKLNYGWIKWKENGKLIVELYYFA